MFKTIIENIDEIIITYAFIAALLIVVLQCININNIDFFINASYGFMFCFAIMLYVIYKHEEY